MGTQGSRASPSSHLWVDQLAEGPGTGTWNSLIPPWNRERVCLDDRDQRGGQRLCLWCWQLSLRAGPGLLPLGDQAEGSLKEQRAQQRPTGAAPSKGTRQWAAPWFSLHESHSRALWAGRLPLVRYMGLPS